MNAVFLAVCAALPAFAGNISPLVIDTDMGRDDVMAIAMILSHREIPVEAITVVNGLAHVPAGAANARRLVFASGRTGIPVFEGRETPIQRTRDFPAEWRAPSDLPISSATVPVGNREPAEVWLGRRLKDTAHRVRILALGPLTNVALALEGANPNSVEEIVIMGGAFHVRGNFGGAAILRTGVPTAEANFFLDPAAAARVFRSGVRIRVVPLDATNEVRMDPAFVASFRRLSRGPLAEVVNKVLEGAHKDITEGNQYAWDALAAAAVIDPEVAVWTPARVGIRGSGSETGRSVIEPGNPNARIALNAERSRFERTFFSAFSPR